MPPNILMWAISTGQMQNSCRSSVLSAIVHEPWSSHLNAPVIHPYMSDFVWRLIYLPVWLLSCCKRKPEKHTRNIQILNSSLRDEPLASSKLIWSDSWTQDPSAVHRLQFICLVRVKALKIHISAFRGSLFSYCILYNIHKIIQHEWWDPLIIGTAGV